MLRNKQILYVYLLVSIRTFSFRFVVFRTIVVGRVVERSVSSTNRPPATLVIKVPIETHEWFVLITFMLQKRSALLDAKLLQISKTRNIRSNSAIQRQLASQQRALTCNDSVFLFAFVISLLDSFLIRICFHLENILLRRSFVLQKTQNLT